MAAWRIVIDRNDFRALVAGREIKTTAGPDEIFVTLDLDYVAGMSRWSDPPEADEFLSKPRRRGDDE